jgi:excinuclease UvrABC nuclease subunit
VLKDDGFLEISQVLHCAVYALVKRGEVVYIGKSKKPLRRLLEHRGFVMKGIAQVPKMSFDSVWILGCMLGQLDTLEQMYIRKYRPKYNIVHNPDRGALVIPEDIKRLLALITPQLPPDRDTFRGPVGPYMVRRL